MGNFLALAQTWLIDARDLRQEASTSAASQNKRRRARADQLEQCAKDLIFLVSELEAVGRG